MTPTSHHIILFSIYFSFLKVQGDDGDFLTPPPVTPAPKKMYKTYLHKAIEAIPKFEERISLFTKKLRLAQYADGTIYDYRLKISQAVLYLNKLPDVFTQEDIDGYLSMLLDRNRYSISFFKHTIFGYYIFP